MVVSACADDDAPNTAMDANVAAIAIVDFIFSSPKNIFFDRLLMRDSLIFQRNQRR
jgi:hypothetical protein